MQLVKKVSLIIVLCLLTSSSWANDHKDITEQLAQIETFVVSNPEQALISIEQLQSHQEQLSIEQQVMLIRHETMANTYLNRHDIALNSIEKAKKLADTESDKSALWWYYNTKAIVYWYMDNVEGSLSLHLKAYDVVKSIGEFRKYQAITEGDIGYAFIKLGFFKQAIPYLESALKSDIESSLISDNIIDLASSYNNLGEAYLGVQNYGKSFELLEKSLNMRIKHGLTFHLSFSYQNLGLLNYKQEKYEQAEDFFIKALKIREEAGFVKGILISKLALAEAYIANNKMVLAEKEIIVLIEKAKNNYTILSKSYDLQRKIYAINNDYQRAYQVSLLYEQALERVVSSKTSVELAGYLNTSETIAKDLNIFELEKNAEIKALQVQSERQNINIILIFGFCILIILAFFLWTVQKSKKIISESNENLSFTLNELKETQEKLVKSGKMSALTTLVSRMAHQVNTPLGIAVTGVSHIHEKVDNFETLIERGGVKKSEIDSLLKDLNKGCELSSDSMSKVADLISQFKMISANLEAETKREFEVLELLTNQVDLALITLNKKKTAINISGSHVSVLGYPEALGKVVSQLITNSIEHAFEGMLVSAIDIKIVKASKHVEIIYQDNGKGIDSSIVNDVFEPFYTTTMGNKNLGIGLSIVYNLVVQLMQGNIKCTPTEGKGTMFCLTLPLIVKS
jgi:signal transduction histidine kinase